MGRRDALDDGVRDRRAVARGLHEDADGGRGGRRVGEREAVHRHVRRPDGQLAVDDGLGRVAEGPAGDGHARLGAQEVEVGDIGVDIRDIRAGVDVDRAPGDHVDGLLDARAGAHLGADPDDVEGRVVALEAEPSRSCPCRYGSTA